MPKRGEMDHIEFQRSQGRQIESGVPTERAGVFAHRVTDQTLLDRYKTRRQIRQRQFDAGMRIYQDWYTSGAAQRVVAPTTLRVDGGGGRPTMTEWQAEKAIEVGRALNSVGVRLQGLVRHVCLLDLPPADWARANGYKPKSGFDLLLLALDMLADHYGLPHD